MVLALQLATLSIGLFALVDGYHFVNVKQNIMTTKQTIKDIQRILGVSQDGLAGPITFGAILRILSKLPESVIQEEESTRIPNDTLEDIKAVYGDPGDESNMVSFIFPYPMKLYGEKRQVTGRCHKLVRDDLLKIFKKIQFDFGMDYIKRHHLDCYFGCFNDRSVRGGTKRSHHAWGIAIDLAANINGNHMKRDEADMPEEVMDIFESFGWSCGGRKWGRDYMHLVRVSP
jgi:hypothetical protein